jgi:hypothetical protein
MSKAAESDFVYCNRCLAELKPGTGDFYRVFIEGVADPTPPNISTEDLGGDVRSKIERLIAGMAGVSEQEALDQVYRRLTFYLCGPCFREWIEHPTG